MAVAVFLGTLTAGLIMNVPIFFVLILCGLALMLNLGITDLAILGQNMIAGTNNFALMAIPFFMLSGEVMGKGGLARRIVDFSNVVVGRLPGGLGYVAILASILFAGLSGSAVADAAALGGLLVPLMMANGYNTERSTGLICAGAVISPIIPPSIPMIVLATSVGLSVTQGFMAGIVPGLVLGLALMFTWTLVVKKDGYTDKITFTNEEAKKIVKESIPALFMPIIIVGGIRMGVFTPTEAGAFAVVYALLISIFVYKEMGWSDIVDVCVEGTISTGIVMAIVAAATAVGWLITIAQIPAQVVVLLQPLIAHPQILLLVIMGFLFIMGMIMDLTPNILIFGPILFPVVVAAGIDPVYFAVLMVLNLTIGLITPPVGIILYIGCSISNIKLGKMISGIMPFLITEIIVLFLLVFFPQLVLVPLSWFM
jgi:tripartite ATP-independent transporter DctM subunit